MAKDMERRHSSARKLVLCFDGTGNKFSGDDSDSNILKIFRCLDREAGDQFHYYQPGIGTYIVSNSLSRTGFGARMKSSYLKAKDSAIGSSFDHHVVGGYRFLMRFYNPGDEIYFFGFSRGAYVARFLAEMLDCVGLLSHGNEEMVAFAWKAFSNWQSRQGAENSEEHRARRREMYRFMKGFRETFSRPVKRIRFLGLFDTVNSVPRFETAWMQRSKFPYTARSSAKKIRHCVSIDERRAKFRQDLIYQGAGGGHRHHDDHRSLQENTRDTTKEKYRTRRSKKSTPAQEEKGALSRGRREYLDASSEEHAFRPHSRSRSQATRVSTDVSRGQANDDGKSQVSQIDEDLDSDDEEQDIDEIWFAGGHGDVGGGWEIIEGRKAASYVPLIYMIREAEKAGLDFDSAKLSEMGLSEVIEESPGEPNGNDAIGRAQDIRINVSSPSPLTAPSPHGGDGRPNWDNDESDHDKGRANDDHSPSHPLHEMIHKAHLARIHDSLDYSSGLTMMQVVYWKIMEYLPFRRMDLQSDGSWKPIRWPLPCGETRDIPHKARVHGSVIRRMQQDENYRPGNLIVGGGGRGMRKAPKEHGMGEWECVSGYGDPIREIWVRKSSPPSSESPESYK